jgi:excisionase family DNA binding protein
LAVRDAEEGSMMTEERLDYKAAAKYLGLAETTVRKLKSRGLIDHFKLGKLVRFGISDLDRYLSARHVCAEEKKLL